MKKLFYFALLPICATGMTFAQSTAKEREAVNKESREQLNKKATKTARKEAKNLKKAGWLTAPGALPIDKQLDKAYLMQFEYDMDGYPLYIMGEAMSVAETYDAAKLQALELAKINLAGQIEGEITALIDNSVANEQLSSDEAASLVKSVAAGKSLISQSLGRVIPVVEVYRDTPNKNKEVLVRIAYSVEKAKQAAKRIIKKDLEAQGNALHERLDSVLGW